MGNSSTNGSTHTKMRQSEDTTDRQLAWVKTIRALWFDPQANTPSNASAQVTLNQYFASVQLCLRKEEFLAKLSGLHENMIIISCGSLYESIRKAVEDCKYIFGVFIFCSKISKYQHFKENPHPHPLHVANDLGHLYEFTALLYRQFQVRDCSTISNLPIALTSPSRLSILLSALSMSPESEPICLSYPLSFLSSQYQTFFPIEEMKLLVERIKAKVRVDELENCLRLVSADAHNPKAYQQMFLNEELRSVLNYCFSKGDYKVCKKLCGLYYCIKGRLLEAGTPVAPSTVFTAIALTNNDLRAWAYNEGAYLVLPAFISTSAFHPAIQPLVPMADRNPTLMTIKLINQSDEFDAEVAKLNLAHESGIVSAPSFFANSLFYPSLLRLYSAKRLQRSY